MNETIQVLQGKHFIVTLSTVRASSGFDWTLKSMPEGIQLGEVWFESEPGRRPPKTNKQFLFFAIDDPGKPVDLVFESIAWHDTSKKGETVHISVQVLPTNSNALSGFVKYSDNKAVYDSADVIAPPYGYIKTEAVDPNFKYGYPLNSEECESCSCDTVVKYGYPCGVAAAESADPCLKYGYPVVKYGYPCGIAAASSADPCLKYGYPCGVAAVNSVDPCLKYGYPCGVAAANSADPCLKYGYPCGVEAANSADPCLKYGYPVVKYGYQVNRGCTC